jgi:hypothetical protein
VTAAIAPELAILLVTDSVDAIRDVARAYAAGVDPAQLELVIAAVGGAALAGSDFDALGFGDVRVVDGGDGDLRVAERRALEAATAPFVVFAQAHARPEPGFADAIARARASGAWTVIGPVMANANPETTWSRAAMTIGYGRWMGAATRGPRSDVPGHNSAYDRSALLALGDDIDGLLEAGWQLQMALAARGGTFLLEPDACTAIVNPSTPGAFTAAFFRMGRMVAAQRRRTWSPARRLAFAAGAPLIPLVRLSRLLRGHQGVEPRLLPLVALGLACSGAGELTGYLRGHGPPSRFVRKA